MKKINFSLPCQHLINGEAFMIILGGIWNKWATPSSIIAASKRVGISSSGLNVEDMQKEKFAQAENCIQMEPKTPEKNHNKHKT